MEKQEGHIEEQRLQERLDVIQWKLDQFGSHAAQYQEEVRNLRKTFWEDVKLNFDSAEEAGETSISIKQQAEHLAERERSHERAGKLIRVLKRLEDSPYFARIDFLPHGETIPLKIYIGVATLMDRQEEQILIYDWRAPISSMYYDHVPGPASYETSEEAVSGEMLLKRQFVIKGGRLQSVFDTEETIGDDVLKEMLSRHASAHIRSIVATIQSEQNQIIRNLKSPHLIVDGVAGSGKTVIALQRAAYILYRFRNQITADQILLISPNALFNRYVRQVLPDLGEENMQQLTFFEYVEESFGKQYEVEHPYHQLESMLAEQDEAIFTKRMAAITYKASLAYQKLLDAYVDLLSGRGMLFKNIVFRGERVIRAEQIERYFYTLDQAMSIPNRLQLVKEWLVAELSKIEEKEREQEWVEEESDLQELEDYTKAYSELLEDGKFNGDTFDDFEQERKRLAVRIVNRHMKPIRSAIKRLEFVHFYGLYRQLFKLDDTMHQALEPFLPREWEWICQETRLALKKRRIKYADAAPMLYLRDQIEGKRINPQIRHVFIDEAQDYAPIQLQVFKQLFPYAQMTVLGDSNQTIHPHTVQNPSLLSPDLYGNRLERVTLSKSYRSTEQITELTSSILLDGSNIESFNRSGEMPTIDLVSDEDELIDQLVNRIKELQQKFGTIAVICKTEAECRQAYSRLQTRLDIQFIDRDTEQYQKQVILLPGYMAKGIEFDAVIIYNASSVQYKRDMERNYFYTACTRAMHALHIYSIGEITPFLERYLKERKEG